MILQIHVKEVKSRVNGEVNPFSRLYEDNYIIAGLEKVVKYTDI